MKCKNCKEVIKPRKFNWKYCESDVCNNIGVKELIKKVRAKKAKDNRKKTKEEKEALLTHKDYLRLLERTFNTLIRIRDKHLSCVSCGKLPPFDLAAGHFYSAGNYSFLRFNELNVHGQCNAHCNMHLSGNVHEYRKRITKRISEEQLEWLDNNCHNELKMSIPEIKSKIVEYKLKIKSLT